MRGKDDFLWWQNVDNGITPAYAGKRLDFYAFSFSLWDHPRLCGEKPIKASEPVEPDGSPPPMRGKGMCSDGMP